MVNILTCCAIGVSRRIGYHRASADAHEWARVRLRRHLGEFTTCSTLDLDTITLTRSGDSSQTFLNVPRQVVRGLAVQLGLIVVERFGVVGR